MIALNIPMQPSSNTPMIAFSRRSCVGERLAELALRRRDLHVVQRRDVVGLVLDACPCPATGASLRVKQSSAKSSLHSVEYFTPALVSEPLRLSMPTSPGHVPGPVGDGEDRPAVRDQPVQHVMRVLPDRLGDDQRRVRVDAARRPPSLPSASR